MPRGGARPGAGRKPNLEIQRAEVLKKKAAPKGFSPDGEKTEDAPADWPFGTSTLPTGSAAEKLTALEFFQAIYKDDSADPKLRMHAASLALPFETARPVALGKKEAKQEEAKKAASKFGTPSAPPKVVAVGGKRI